jgi:hypothetical protein
MRNQPYSLLSLITFAGVAAAGFIGACGGKVVVESSGTSGGEGGAGGSGSAGGQQSIVATSGVQTGPITTGPNTTTGVDVSSSQVAVASSSVGVGPGPSSVAATGVSSVAASSSTGVVNSCDDACNKASMCGLDFCNQFNINCANPPTQAQCPLDCISVASCGDIAKLAMQNFGTPLGACILGCQGMGPGGVGSSGVGSTGSGPPPQGCQQCTLQQCGTPIFQCNAKKGPGSCSHWLQCAQGCGTDSMCLFGCDSQFPNAAVEYDAVYSCLCNKCDTSCPAENACSHTGVSPAGGTGP